jgi:hypothetical protein
LDASIERNVSCARGYESVELALRIFFCQEAATVVATMSL